MGMRGAPAPAKRAARARSVDNARRLWEESEKLTGTTFPLSANQLGIGAVP